MLKWNFALEQSWTSWSGGSALMRFGVQISLFQEALRPSVQVKVSGVIRPAFIAAFVVKRKKIINTEFNFILGTISEISFAFLPWKTKQNFNNLLWFWCLWIHWFVCELQQSLFLWSAKLLFFLSSKWVTVCFIKY